MRRQQGTPPAAKPALSPRMQRSATGLQLGRMCIAIELNEATCAHTAERVREA